MDTKRTRLLILTFTVKRSYMKPFSKISLAAKTINVAAEQLIPASPGN